MASTQDLAALLEALQRLPLADRQKIAQDLACQTPEKTKAKIPGEISLDHYTAIAELLSSALNETGAMQVVARLNETGKDNRAPVFIGWVENDLRARARLRRNDPHPALLRAGDTDSSTTYERCFLEGSVERDWTRPDHVQERKSIELCLSQKTGVNYLRVLRIEVPDDGNQRRGVGVLGVGFSQKPADLAKIDDILRTWAQSDNRNLVPYLKKNFDLGGRVL